MAGARTTLALGALLLLAGVVLAAYTLLIPGIALLLIAVVLTAWVRLASAGVQVTRTGMPKRVGEGEGFEVVHEVKAGRLPLLGELVDPLLAEPRSLGGVGAGRSTELRSEGRLLRRGRHLLPAPAARIADPLGITSRQVAGEGVTPILVLPRVEPVSFSADDGASGGRRRAAAGELPDEGLRESAADPEIEGLRPYRAGSRASRIYWPALARGEELQERHLSPAADSGPLVVLDTREADEGDALDRAVRAAASLVAHLGRGGGCELTIGGDHRRHRVSADPETLLAARSALALAAGRDGSPRPGKLASASTVIWVSAGGARPPFGRRTTGVLVTPEPQEGRESLLTVAGCFGYALATPSARAHGAKVAA